MTKNIVILGAGTAGTMMSNHLRRALKDDWTITITNQGICSFRLEFTNLKTSLNQLKDLFQME